MYLTVGNKCLKCIYEDHNKVSQFPFPLNSSNGQPFYRCKATSWIIFWLLVHENGGSWIWGSLRWERIYVVLFFQFPWTCSNLNSLFSISGSVMKILSLQHYLVFKSPGQGFWLHQLGFQPICSSKCEYLTESSLSNSIIHHALLNLDKIYNTLEAGWSFFLTLLSIVRNSGMRDWSESWMQRTYIFTNHELRYIFRNILCSCLISTCQQKSERNV